MINYSKLQFNYLFSRVFTMCFLFLVLGSFAGIVISSSIDLGYNYLDGFINDFSNDYLMQSLLIIEVVGVISSIFVGTFLGSKNNNYLICYSCNYYREKAMFYFSRGIVSVIYSFIYILLVGVFYLLYTRTMTPYFIETELVVKGLVAVFFICIYLSCFSLLVMSIISHLIMIIIPLLIFWYLKTIYDFKNLESEFQETVIKLFPGYLMEESLKYYQDIYVYVFIYFVMFSLVIIINTFKDF